jgi:hypothetical protein
MPARVVSSAASSRESTGVARRVAVASTSRLIKSEALIGKDDVKGKRVADKVRKEDGSDAKGELVLSAIKSPKSCSRSTVNNLATLLGTSLSELEICNSAASTSKIKLNGKQSSASLRQSSTISNGSTTNALSETKRVHLAKLVVNAVIASLNDLIWSGWKHDVSKENTTERGSSRSTSASSSSTKALAMPAKKSVKTTPTPAGTTVTETNITCIFDCARVAVHFLILEEKKASMPKVKEHELEFIMSSIVRKIVAMDLVSYRE